MLSIRKSSLVTAFLLLVSSVLILSRTSNFPDYNQYNLIISEGWFSIYGHREPLSYVFLKVMHEYSLDAFVYYGATFIISVFITLYIASRYDFYLRRTLIFFLLFNPLILISFQTPRQYLATFLILALMHVASPSKLFFAISSIFTHNITGAFGLAQYASMRNQSKKLIGKYLIIGLSGLGVLLVAKAFMQHYSIELFSQYLSYFQYQWPTVAGRYQTLLFILYALLFFVLRFNGKISIELIVYLFIFFLLILLFYFFHPLIHRFFAVFLSISFLIFLKNRYFVKNFFAVKLVTLVSVAVSYILFVGLGMFGYG